jgi:hypothetical protein
MTHFRVRAIIAVAALLLMASPLGAVVFAATRVNSTVLQVAGTKTELVQLIEPVMAAAGWTTISGTGTGDVVMESADPAGAVPAIRLRLFDTAANTASFSIRNVAATQISNSMFLLPAAAKTWRIIANEYQFLIFHTSSTTTARNYVSGGIPAVASFLAPSPVWWGLGDTATDAGVTLLRTFRQALNSGREGCGTPASGGLQASNYNGTLLDGAASAANSTGPLTLLSPYAATTASAGVNQYNAFPDNSYMVSDAYIGWGTAGVVASSPMRYVGTMYDAIVVSATSTVDTTITFNGNNYWVITSQTVGTSCNPSALAVRVP